MMHLGLKNEFPSFIMGGNYFLKEESAVKFKIA